MAQSISTDASSLNVMIGFPSPERGEMLPLHCTPYIPPVRQGRDGRMAQNLRSQPPGSPRALLQTQERPCLTQVG